MLLRLHPNPEMAKLYVVGSNEERNCSSIATNITQITHIGDMMQ